MQPIGFASWKLHNAEMHHSADERELLGIIWARGQWWHCFQSHYSVVVLADHSCEERRVDQAAFQISADNTWKSRTMQRIQVFSPITWWLPGASPTRSRRCQNTGKHTRTHTAQRLQTQSRESEVVTLSERARITYHSIHHMVAHPGHPSDPTIPSFESTLTLYDSQPPIWCRGPRRKAHWYMYQIILIKQYLTIPH